MHSVEPALRAVHAQVQFELAEVAAQVVQAAAESVRAHQEVVACMQRCLSYESTLRAAMERQQVNPALLTALRSMYHTEQLALHERQTRLRAAEQCEQEMRGTLADLRNSERSLERALRAERRKQRLRRLAREMTIEDDLWLQREWSRLQ